MPPPPSPSPFHSPQVDAARRNDGVAVGRHRCVRLPRVFGFCGGVRAAVRMLQRETESEDSRPLWLLGPLIHNHTVNQWFRRCGVRIVPEGELESVFEQASGSDRFVVPAFGVPLPLARRLREFASSQDYKATVPPHPPGEGKRGEACGGRIVDTTCRYVSRIWAFAGEQAAQGRTIVIHGKPGHPETEATLSRSLGPDNAAILVPNRTAAEQLAEAIGAGDLSAYPPDRVVGTSTPAPRRLATVNQTTMLYSETRHIEAILRAATGSAGGDLAVLNTVCRATQERQEAACELRNNGNCACFLVVGGFNSSNTNRLYTLAKQSAPTYFIRDANDLDETTIRHYVPDEHTQRITHHWLPSGNGDIGLLAGASCPDGVVGDIIGKVTA